MRQEWTRRHFRTENRAFDSPHYRGASGPDGCRGRGFTVFLLVTNVMNSPPFATLAAMGASARENQINWLGRSVAMTSDKQPAMEEHEMSSPLPVPPAADCWYLTGATAAGKSAVAIELAGRLNAEIISLDSMAVYEGMDIGTAKPSAEQRAAVPHHLLDVVPPTEDYSLSSYIDAAHEAIAKIRAAGKVPLFVGGTPLYLKSLLRGVYQGPPADWEFREQIEQELHTLPLEALHERLSVIDPLAAAKLHPHDKRRIVRALEVFRLTGVPLSHQQMQFDEGRPATAMHVFVLQWPREQLHERIQARVDQMFAAGLVDEVRGLLKRYGSLSRTACQAVGYREVLDYLRSLGEVNADDEHPRPAPMTLADCSERVKIRTRQFARRQETWFRSLSECTFVPQVHGKSPLTIAVEILAMCSGSATTA